MANPSFTSGSTDAAAPTVIRGVADDMVAIFGPAVRSDPPPIESRALSTQLRQKRPWPALLAVAAVVTTLTAGVVGGRNVIGTQPVAKAPRARVDRPTLHTAEPPVGTVMPAAAAAVASPPALAQATPAAASAPSEMLASVDSADPATASRRPVEAVEPVIIRPTPARIRPDAVRATSNDDRRAAAPIGMRRADCVSDADCLASRIYAAEGELAGAYDAATGAGVGARVLRDYRDEWLRARRLSNQRPREALRIYGMIIDDLRTFTDDATDNRRASLQ